MNVTVREYTVDELPSIASLSNYDDYRNIRNSYDPDTISYLNSTFNNTGYFNSEYDRYSKYFADTVNYFYNRSMSVESDLKVALGAISEIDAYRICNTEESLRNIPPCMVEPITFGTEIYNLYRQHKVQGWIDYTDEEIKENRRKWKRILDWNGVNRYNPRSSKDDAVSTFRIINKTGDRELTFEERDDIEATREYVNYILENTDIDPTDMDEIIS